MPVVADAIRYRTFASPEGEFYVALRDVALIETGWTSLSARDRGAWRRDPSIAAELIERIRAAIAGHPVDFTDVAIPESGPFFVACRRACQRIPTGLTLTYSQLAAKAGSPAASRAAGQAMRRNPTPIVVPCHRVIAASGAIGGFSGQWASAGGACPEIDVKTALLAREASRGSVHARPE